jgi:hypothetical protein
MQDKYGELEKRFEEFEDETNHNLTMLLGQSWKHGEQLRMLKSTMLERFDKVDDRVTEAHRDLAQLELTMRDVKTTLSEHGQKLDEILALLKKP